MDAYNRDNSKKLASGMLVTLDNQIDSTTGTSKLKAVFDNKDNTLFPQQFVNISVLVDTLANQFVVPNVAVQNGQQGTFVYVVDDDSKVHLRPVQVGITTAPSADIISGISDGDRVVVDGADRLIEGGHGPGAEGRRNGQPSRLRGGAQRARRKEGPWQGLKRAGRRRWPVSPSRIFILRPVATSLMMAGVVLVGVMAFQQLPVSAFPQVDYPTIQIQTFYPGASPEVMTSSVTAPLEKQFGQVPGLWQMTSISSFGSSLITLQFSLDLNIDIAEQEVQAAINAAGTFLPTSAVSPNL